MNRAGYIIDKLKKNMPVFAKNYGVKAMEVFGSYVKGRQKKKSDVDILVEFAEPIDLFKFMELEGVLSELLNIKVDLVMKDTLKPRIKEKVLKEAMPV